MTAAKPYLLYLRYTITLILFGTGTLRAMEGPGFPNLNYSAAQEGTVLSMNDPGKAISPVLMHRGYLFVPLGADHGGGNGAGAFVFYDISDPANISSVFDSRDHTSDYHVAGQQNYAGDFAELHHLPVSGNLMMISEKRSSSAGYSILDVSNLYDSDPLTRPEIVSRYSYPGVTSPTNYDGYSFALGWQGRKYLWGPSGSNGLFIVDTSDFNNPQLIASIPRSQLSNVTVRSAVPIGNLLLLSTSAVANSFTTIVMDISDPANPQQLNTFNGKLGYQPWTYGAKMYGGGQPLEEYDFTDPFNIVKTTLNAATNLDRPEYGFGKDGHIFVGHYPGMTKWELNGTSTTQVQTVDSGLVDDHAFLSPIGNLIAVTSDHNNDRKLILGIHDQHQDLTPPAVNFSSPADGDTNIHIKSRVGLSFTDFIDPMTVDSSSCIVRPFGSVTPVPGTYSTMTGIVNFAPDADLAPNTTYEVVLAAGGVADQSGNAIAAETVVAKFSTGPTISAFTTTVVTDSAKEAGQSANFSLTIGNPGGFTLEHAWDFGDGTPLTAYSASTSTSHSFAVAGNHTVTAHSRKVGDVNPVQSTGVQVVHHSLPAEQPVQSATIVYDDSNGLVWNVNPDNDTLSAIDATTFANVYELATGDDPKTAALGPGDTIWVANKGDATLSVFDRGTGNLLNTHSLPYASAPHGIAIDVANTTAYVSLEATGQIAKVDTSTGNVTATLDVGPWPRHLAYDPTRDRLWVTRFISPDTTGEVHAIDTTTFTLVGTTTLAQVMEPDSLTNGRGLPNYLGALAISPDGTQAFVPAKKDNIFRGVLRDGLQLTFEHSVRSMASRIDLGTGLEDPGKRIDFDNSDFATAVAFSPLGNQMFFTTNGSTTIWVVDAYDPTNTFTFASGGLAPAGLTLSPDGSRLFVHNFMSRTLTVFDTSVVCATVCGTAPQLATVSTVGSEALASNVLLGKQHFYNSSDPRLSLESYMSCASCHLDGGHDGRVWDFTGFGEGLRETISLTGHGSGHGPAHWTANFDEIHDFEGQIRSFAGGTGLMDDSFFNQGTRSEPLGLAKAGISSDLDALADYVGSLQTNGRSPHRNSNGSLTTDAVAGRELFKSLNCGSCHNGDAFTDSVSLARHDVGTYLASSGQRLGGTLDGFDTPTLRGLWASGPYLHDGRAATVKDVLTTHNASNQHADLSALSTSEVDQLVAYLLQIDDLEATAPTSTSNLAPTLTDPGATSTEVDLPFSLSLVASDPESDTLEYFATGLPEGLSIDSNSGVISGTPVLGTVGDHSVRLSVRDPFGNSDTQTLDLTINFGPLSPGLWYGAVPGNIDTNTPNPESSVTTDLSETEDSIADDTTEIYTGEIYDADGSISFTEHIDDKARIYIDGVLVLSDDTWSSRTSTANLNLTAGWHDIEIRISNGGGGSGATGSPGIGYDPAGGTTFVHLEDPGDGSVLRHVTAGGGTTLGGAVISVNWDGSTNNTLAAGDSAGIVAATNWTNVDGFNGVTNAQDGTGVATTLDLAVSGTSTGEWRATNNPASDADSQMMEGAIFANHNGWTVTGTQVPYSSYELYVYIPGDATGRDYKITVGSDTFWYDSEIPNTSGVVYTRVTTDTDPGGSNATVGNYAVFTGLTGDFTITVAGHVDGPNAPTNPLLAGLQVVGIDTTPPAAPTGLTATAGNGEVDLNWTANGEGDLASYTLKRSTTQGGSYTDVATGLTDTSHTDTGLPNGTTYYYVLSAVDTTGNGSALSAEASATLALNFDDWWASHSLSGASDAGDDSDGDLVGAGLEYAFNLDPKVADYTVLEPGGTAGLPFVGLDGSGHLTITYLRRKHMPAGSGYTVQVSTALASWAPATGTESPTDIDATWERVTFTVDAATAALPAAFLRIKIVLP